MEEGTKYCRKCKLMLPRSAFNANKRVIDGLNSWCRECASAYWRKRKTEREAAVAADPDVILGRWLRSTRAKIGLQVKEAERLARLPRYRLAEIEAGEGYGIKRQECVQLALVYKIDAGVLVKRAAGVDQCAG